MGKCMRAGPITNNAYLNFLREFRPKCCDLSPKEVVKKGAAEWNKLSAKEKDSYKPKTPITPRRSRKRGKKCMRPGPITKNGYLNFLRDYRRKHCGLSPKEIVIRGARAWRRLTKSERNKYGQKYSRVARRSRSRRRSSSRPRCSRSRSKSSCSKKSRRSRSRSRRRTPCRSRASSSCQTGSCGR